MAAVLVGCSSGDTLPKEGGSGAGGGENTAGSTNAAGQSSGGSGNGGHTAGSGGSPVVGSGGSQTAGAGGKGAEGCHNVAECPSRVTPPFGGVPMCLVPGQAPPSGGCGAPQWCGQCSCPAQPQVPMGTGMACQTSQDCPEPGAGTSAARVCNGATCTACVQDSDCPNSTVCGQVTTLFGAGPTNFRICTACNLDSDCPSARPFCQANYGASACVACRTTSDCQSGICSSGTCTPVCSAAAPCGPALQCNAQQRCEALSCQRDVDCPKNIACSGGHCARRACTSDATCEGNCVNGFCYDSLGTCYELLQAP